MPILYPPKLKSPIGGEKFTSNEIDIVWEIPPVLTTDNKPVSFEILYAENFEESVENQWKKIASFLPSSLTQFQWSVPNSLKSNKVRIGIRTKNYLGQESEMDISLSNFEVNRFPLVSPQILSPSSEKKYSNYITVLANDRSFSSLNYYLFSYSSSKLGIPQTTIAETVPSSSLPFQWDVSGLPASDDYVFYARTADRNGNYSEDTVVPDITIEHSGSFLIDTLPPDVSVRISGNKQYTNNRNISINVYAYDETTDVSLIQTKELDSTEKGKPQTNRNTVSYTVSDGDGVKRVGMLAEDIGGNLNNQSIKESFIDCIPDNNSVVDFNWDKTGKVNGVFVVASVPNATNSLYQIRDTSIQILSFDENPISVCVYEGSIYIASSDSKNYGHLNIKSITGFSRIALLEDSLAIQGVLIVDMEVFDDKLFMGISDGRLLSFDGTSVLTVGTASSPFESLATDNGNVIGTLSNSSSIVMSDGNSFREIEL